MPSRWVKFQLFYVHALLTIFFFFCPTCSWQPPSNYALGYFTNYSPFYVDKPKFYATLFTGIMVMFTTLGRWMRKDTGQNEL